MKRWQVTLLIFILAVLLAACADSAPDRGDTSATGSSPSPNAQSSDITAGYSNYSASIVEIDAVIEALQNPGEWVVIDVRTPEEYDGDSRLPNAFGSGRLKGAVNVNRELVFDSDGELLPREELMNLYGFIGDRKAIVYCHGGVRSALIWTVLIDLGFDALHYDGSWIDWSREASVADGAPNDVVLGLTEEWTDNEGEIGSD